MIMRPTVDFAFKKIFGNEQKPEILIGFLNAVMECPPDNRIEHVTIKNPNNEKEFKEESFSILDVKAETNRKELINIEIQIATDVSMVKRSLYYGSRMFTSQSKPSNCNYNTLKNVVSIIIMDYILEELRGEPFHCTCYFTSVQTKQIITDAWISHYIQLPKLTNPNMEVEKEVWFDFLRDPEKYISSTHPREENTPLVSAVDELKRLSLNADEVELYLAREKQLMDYESQLASAYEEGIEEGMEKGIELGMEQGLEKGLELGMEKARLELITNAIEKGMSKDMIFDLFGCSSQEYDKILCHLQEGATP